ncbi:hypothetical protein FWP33_18765 [Vibrio parahaemolyticus]|jgi:hypothetical protein|uniref:Uncharacterized protein n=1 Tax=Vibrio jasicida TaxID=766224 RepID=A0AAU9QT44_9VIBR|nr:hypothetical protein [Vibrio parahaemolyticus]EJC7176218.1 hypothetical protein [Vibrio parahaemolyticus]EJG0009952.1 hypothetical protein [Vibrio parahaemolyticus]CAH1598993.1 exported hypothetical protein [Vibrio jasicida]CAH1601372.1 exported hypothetical protein [Vibrio jasicida]
MKAIKFIFLATSMLAAGSYANDQAIDNLSSALEKSLDQYSCPSGFSVEFEVYETEQTVIYSKNKDGRYSPNTSLKACDEGWLSYENYCVMPSCAKSIFGEDRKE